MPAEYALTGPEMDRLAMCEEVIERGLATFVDVGMALLEVRDSRLYRLAYPTFEAYCEARWNMSRSRAHRLIEAAGVASNLLPTGNIPANERTARELARLEPAAQREVWQAAVESAPDGKITAAHVRETAAAIKREQRAEREAERAERRELLTERALSALRCELHHCDLLEAPVALGSVDAVITDPPYGVDYRDLYAALARVSAFVLKPGGSLVVMTGQSDLPAVLQLLSEFLDYQWTFAYLTPGGQSAQLWQQRVNTFWKPVLWFTKGGYTGGWKGDVLKSAVNDNDKSLHEWQQSASGMRDIVTRFTEPNDVVFDPFMGSGTTGAVCMETARHFIGCDVDREAVQAARERLADYTEAV